MNLDHDFLQGEQIKWRKQKRSSPKVEDFFSPNLGEDQNKKGLHQKWSTFSRILVETCAQMHTRVKVLGGCRCWPSSNYWRDISPPGFGTSASNTCSCFRSLRTSVDLSPLSTCQRWCWCACWWWSRFYGTKTTETQILLSRPGFSLLSLPSRKVNWVALAQIC